MANFPFLRVLLALVPFGLASCGKKETGEVVVLTGASTIAPVVADAAKGYEAANPGVRIEIQTGGSSRGIADTLSGIAELGMVSRVLAPDEAEKLTAHRIAADGVCVVLHKDNPVEDLTKERLIDIYTKKVVNWKEYGGPDATIVVVNKAEGRSTLEVFLQYLGLDNADVKADVVAGENLHVINSVVGNPNSIGYVSIGTATTEAQGGTPIKLISTGGVAPTPENVASGAFPITRPLTIVEDAQTSPAAKAFLDHLKSPAINDIVEKHFFVPVN